MFLLPALAAWKRFTTTIRSRSSLRSPTKVVTQVRIACFFFLSRELPRVFPTFIDPRHPPLYVTVVGVGSVMFCLFLDYSSSCGSRPHVFGPGLSLG